MAGMTGLLFADDADVDLKALKAASGANHRGRYSCGFQIGQIYRKGGVLKSWHPLGVTERGSLIFSVEILYKGVIEWAGLKNRLI